MHGTIKRAIAMLTWGGPQVERPALLAAVGTPCPYCGTAMRSKGRHQASRDCVIPKSRGGTYATANVEIVCGRCNGDKANWSLVAFHAALLAESDPRAAHVAAVIAERSEKGLTT